MGSIYYNPVLAAMVISLAVLSASCRSGNTSTGSDATMNGDPALIPEIEFNTLTHDFGVLTEGEKIACVFTFTNKGEGSLVINSASASCGCTVPQFSKKPLRNGEKGTMEVVFNTAGFGGIQTKTITVQSNARTPVVILAIKADIRSKIK
ncbi:MAG: DUF1573 domain-containing protein [Bacteroidetes bacterium]|nr:DUF1573 domain-containing protein [Bacteroidota bacterium]